MQAIDQNRMGNPHLLQGQTRKWVQHKRGQGEGAFAMLDERPHEPWLWILCARRYNYWRYTASKLRMQLRIGFQCGESKDVLARLLMVKKADLKCL